MTYSKDSPCYVSKKAYGDIEDALEEFYNSQENPYRNYFENAVRVPHEYIVNKFDLVIEDIVLNESNQEDSKLIGVRLESKENTSYVPFKQVFHKELGDVE